MASAFGFDFSSAAAGGVGLNVAQGIGSFLISRGARSVAQANADARNIVRGGQNEQRIAESKLSALVRSINNRRRLTAAGEQADAVTNTALRAQEAFTAGQVEQGLRLSESLGAAQAQAAASGMGGSSVEALNGLLAGKAARLEQAQVQAQERSQYDLYKQRAGVLEAGVQSLDFSPIVANLDRGVDMAPASSAFGSLIGNLIGNLASTEDQRKTLNAFLGSVSRQPQGVGSQPGFQDLGSGFSSVGYVDPAQSFRFNTPSAPYSSITIGGST